MSGRVVVLGSTNIDLVSVMPDFPVAGQTLTGNQFTLHMGGKGANQAVMAARGGARVSFISGVGEDDFAESALSNLASNGVDISGVTRFPGSTGVASIWVDGRGENQIVLNPGANHLLDAEMVLAKLESWRDIRYLVAQLEIPINVVISAFARSKAQGVVTILNPAPFQELPKSLLDNADWLIVNEIEFASLHPRKQAPTSDDVIREIAHQKVIITLGANGAIVVNGEISRLPAPEVAAVDTTGAGDCFVGSFAAALSLGLEVESAVRFGIACASQSVKSLGAQSSYPTIERATELIKSLDRDSL